MRRKAGLLTLVGLILSFISQAQLTEQKKKFAKADTLRGSITEYRKGWDVLHYNLSVFVDIMNRSLTGSNKITYYESLPVRRMQIDLQTPLIIDSVISENGNKLSFEKDGDVWLVRLKPDGAMIKFLPGERSLTVYYHGTPKAAKKAPWDGGLVWKEDTKGRPFIATACQGLGASAWWPCKDHQSDEPDSGMVMSFTIPDTLTAVSNGRLKNVSESSNGNKTWMWEVKNPINTYGVTMNIGKYTNWSDTLMGEAGKLDLNYWVLDYNSDSAKRQFEQVKPMLRSFEHWFGKYPFYEDGYKLIETPFLGMEHQSAVAYGNRYQNGYLGKDLSGTGWGLKWDFIVIHESGHEWFGNNITTKDIADMWVHEGFTNYSETLFTETYYGRQAADEYCYGIRKNIDNDIPIIGIYGVNEEGSGDMYYKASNMIHSIRKTINDDDKFRSILRGLNDTFYHKTVTSNDIENYISNKSAINFSKAYDQYLRTTQIPVLQYYFSPNKQTVYYKWTNCVKGFNMPLTLKDSNTGLCLKAEDKWKSMKVKKEERQLFDKGKIERDYYIEVKEGKL